MAEDERLDMLFAVYNTSDAWKAWGVRSYMGADGIMTDKEITLLEAALKSDAENGRFYKKK